MTRATGDAMVLTEGRTHARAARLLITYCVPVCNLQFDNVIVCTNKNPVTRLRRQTAVVAFLNSTRRSAFQGVLCCIDNASMYMIRKKCFPIIEAFGLTHAAQENS